MMKTNSSVHCVVFVFLQPVCCNGNKCTALIELSATDVSQTGRAVFLFLSVYRGRLCVRGRGPAPVLSRTTAV